MDPDAILGGEWGWSRNWCDTWGGYHRRGRGSFEGEFGTSHWFVTNGTLLCSCAKVHETMELSFEVVSWVVCGMGVLEGGPCAPRGKRFFVSIGFNGVFFKQKCIRLVREKLTTFLYGLYIIGINDSLAFQRYSQV